MFLTLDLLSLVADKNTSGWLEVQTLTFFHHHVLFSKHWGLHLACVDPLIDSSLDAFMVVYSIFDPGNWKCRAWFFFGHSFNFSNFIHPHSEQEQEFSDGNYNMKLLFSPYWFLKRCIVFHVMEMESCWWWASLKAYVCICCVQSGDLIDPVRM